MDRNLLRAGRRVHLEAECGHAEVVQALLDANGILRFQRKVVAQQ